MDGANTNEGAFIAVILIIVATSALQEPVTGLYSTECCDNATSSAISIIGSTVGLGYITFLPSLVRGWPGP